MTRVLALVGGRSVASHIGWGGIVSDPRGRSRTVPAVPSEHARSPGPPQLTPRPPQLVSHVAAQQQIAGSAGSCSARGHPPVQLGAKVTGAAQPR